MEVDMSDVDGRPEGVSRRALVKGAAWAVPVIAFAAPLPAAAASPCMTVTNTALLQVGTTAQSVSFLDPQGNPTGVSAALNWTGFVASSGLVLQTTVAPTVPYILMETRPRPHAYTEMTISFNQPVTGFSFTLGGIDQWRPPLAPAAYVDLVQMTTVGYTAQLGSNVVGAGVPGDSFRPMTLGIVPIGDSAGDARISYPAALTSVVFRLIAGFPNEEVPTQSIGISNLRYESCPNP
jgi:hypothetical protein